MDHLHKSVIAFQHRVNDYIDDNSHHLAQSLKQEVQKFEDDVQVNKNPRTIDERVKRIIPMVEHAADAEVISHSHADELIDQCKEFREELRRMF